jgi:hypothetical protein
MADTKLSALSAAAAAAAANEFEINEAGTSKKVTGTQIRNFVRGLTAPSIISVGTEFSSTGVPTATLPGTHATDDIIGLALQISNDVNYPAPSGYKPIGPQNGIGAAAAAGSTKLVLFWKRDGGSETAPTLTDAGDHTYGVMFAVRGCKNTGTPFHLSGNAWKFTTSTAATGPKSTTACDNMLVMDVFAQGVDNASGQMSGSATNADMSSITTQFNDGTTDGFGGGLTIITGIVASAKSVTSTTLTWSNTTVDVATRIHWIPADVDSTVMATRPAEVQSFIGSAADLDDTWFRSEPGARRVLVQLMDGGGSGSGGNTTTTAAGGGGGGGGGYDEAWYDPIDIGTSVTVHAGKGGAAGTALNQAGNAGVISEFDKGGQGPLTSARRIAGTASTAAASADGGNGGCGSGRGTAALAVNTTRSDLYSLPAANNLPANGAGGGRGGSGTTAPVGGSPADWGGGGGESGADTDASTTGANNGYSLRGGGGGGGGRTTTNIGGGASGGGAAAPAATQGQAGPDSTRFPYGGAGGCGGGSSVVLGGAGGFPGGAGGGGAGVAGGFGGAGGNGMVVVTTFF